MNKDNLTYGKIFTFWVPLAATWLMMSVEGPFLAAVISRMPEPKFNLAAYGVAFSFALIIEAPIIMIMSASTALVKGKCSFVKLKKFTYWMNYVITGIMLVFLIPPVFDFIAMDLIGLPPEVARLTYLATAILLPWPGMIGYRRFYQGILIRYNKTRRVAYGTIIRLSAMSGTALLIHFFTAADGVVVGAAALSAGVTTEGIASKLMALDILKRFEKGEKEEGEKILSYREIYNFYYPLALTSILALGVNPMVTFFMGQARFPIESLAVLPVVNSLVFIFRSLGLSYQEVSIAKLGDNLEEFKPLRNFAIMLGLGSTAVLFLIGLTPLMELWYSEISGLTAELTSFAGPPTIIMGLMPALTVLVAFQRSLLVQRNNTRPITIATLIEVGGIIGVLFVTISFLDMTGVIAAAFAYLFGRLFTSAYLYFPYSKEVAAGKASLNA